MAANRICVLHPITRLIVGGAQENTMYTAALLDRERYQVDVLCGPQTGSEGSLIEETRERGVDLTILPELLRQVSLPHDLRAIARMARLMRKRGYTIVHTHSSKAGILGRLAARLAGVPILVHTVHGWSFHDHMRPALRRLYIGLERLAASFTQAMIVVAERDIQKGLRQGIGSRDQYHLIRSAIPLDEFDPGQYDRREVRRALGIPIEAPVLGNVGRFSAQKNPLDWVRIAGRIGRAQPNARFLLVGDGPLRSEVERGLQAEGIAGRTVLTGLRRDPGRMMAAMDVFLLTSLWEGLPRVLPQAMSIGLPVAAYDVDGSAEVVLPGETGTLCPPGALDEMAAGCLELLRDPALRLQMGLSGQARARSEFDLTDMIARIDGLYQDLLRRAELV
jgi:glycosyltransferase involved in cell wall biosynthesis